MMAGIQTELLIGGKWGEGVDGGRIAVENPFDGSILAHVAEATAADVDLAVEAAQAAVPAWRALPAHERGRLLRKLADRIEADTEYLARLEAQDTGHPIRDCLALDVPRTVLCFRYFGGMADKLRVSRITSPRGPARFAHPTTKPDALMEKIMANVAGMSVCDAFMGTGTTGVAAIRAGKRFVGIEHNPVHFATAVRRIEAAIAGIESAEAA